MFENMRKKVDETVKSNEIETIIGKDTSFIGSVGGAGSIRIDGRIDGDISVGGNVVVGETGIVNGNISAANLLISGNVTGNVNITDKLTIYGSGQLIGDICCRQFNVADGGIFQGRSEMAPRVLEPAVQM